jgi:hypothetical protein
MSTEPAGFHGLAAEGVHFGIANWPYDLLLRFGYDLPENEHTWGGKWFDDGFEAAAFEIRATAAKLMLALKRVHRTTALLREAVAEEVPPARLAEVRTRVERTPLHIDLAFAYLWTIGRDVATVIPCCFGVEGRALLAARESLAGLRAGGLASLDAGLALLVGEAPAALTGEGMRLAHTPELYVVAGSAGYAAALPRAAGRRLRESAACTLEAAEALAAAVNESCRWCDAVLAHLERVVAERSEPGPELLERWAERDWSLVMRVDEGGAAALSRFLPALP